MTDRERAIIQAHTGAELLKGKHSYKFVDYCAERMGRVLTESDLQKEDVREELKERSAWDFKCLVKR